MARRQNDIERYLKGKMSPAEMYELEKEALNDFFLAEALEGATQAGAEIFLYDLQEMRSSFRRRVTKHKPQMISIWRWSLGIAAGLVLLAVTGIYVIININQQKAARLAMKEQTRETKPDSSQQQTITADSAEAAKQPGKHSHRQKITGNPPGASRRRATRRNDVARSEAKPTVEHAARFEAQQRDTKATELQADELYEEIPATQPVISEAPASPTTQIIRGKVTSQEDGTGMPGVNVLIKGTAFGTVTNQEGQFEIEVTGKDPTLVFAFIGYKPMEVPAADKKELNVQLKTDNVQLSEVVVTGSGASQFKFKDVELAQPQGGRDAFGDYLKDNVQYPQTALHNNVEGRVLVQFTVEADGQLKDFKVLKGIGAGCEEELIRLIKEGPLWTPTRQNGRPVSDKVKVRFKFDIPQ